MAHSFSSARRFALLVALGSVACSAFAQSSYPSKPVRVIVPAAAGSAADLVARMLGERISKTSPYPWVIENRPGAGGIVGSDVVAKASPDGQTLLFTANNFIIAPHLFASVPYDIYKDFSAIGLVATGQDMIFINSSLNVKSLADLVALSKRTPEGINYGAPFLGSSSHLIMETLARMTGMKLTFIPASGGPQSFVEALSGRVPVVVGTPFAGVELVKTGKFNALAVIDNQRSTLLPDVPTLKEAGYPAINLPFWFGLYGPAKMQPAILAQVNADMNRALASPEFADALASKGYYPTPGTPAELDRTMRLAEPVFARTIVDANIKQ